MSYVFKKWNGKYGNGAKFVVEDESNGKQSMFTPSNPSDLAWTNQDLTKDSEVASWGDFGNEKVENLNEVVF